MKALWIRVEAHELRSVRMREFAARLGVSRAAALGHFVALGGAIAEQLEDGNIRDVADDVLADWGGWGGKADRFASAVREILQGADGDFANWSESMGKLVQRRALDRQRKSGKSADVPRKVRGSSVEIPGNVRGNSAATERNGTGRRDTSSIPVVEIENKRSSSQHSRAGPRATDTAAPLRSLALDAVRRELRPTVLRFLDHFYALAVVGIDQHRDKAIQLAALQRGDAIPDHRKQLVRAYSLERLERKCNAVRTDTTLRDRKAAMAVLFTKLGDTTDVAAANALPGQQEAVALTPTGPLDPAVEALIAGVADARAMPAHPLPTVTKS